jgi:hypothetical protein
VSTTTAWATLAALGAYHGLNPAMGWLFAVSQGLQHGDRRAVTRSFLPIAVGHEGSVVVVAALVLGLGVIADPGVLRVVAAVALLAFGLFRFVRPRWHPRWTTMRVDRRELTLWSFLMSSAHGAGLMVAPVLIGGGAAAQASGGHDPVMAVVATIVYARLGVEVLRRAWLNTDSLWAAAFVMAGLITLFT